MKETEIIKMLFDYMITVVELSDTQRLKNIAIKEQDYETASLLRSKELEIQNSLPSVQYMKDLRSKLNE